MKKLGHSIKSGWLEKIESSIDTEGDNYKCDKKVTQFKTVCNGDIAYTSHN